MLKMTDKSRVFLEKNLPGIFSATTVGEALEMLYDLIDEKGFAPPSYEEYNDFGREAQSVYGDLYLSN